MIYTIIIWIIALIVIGAFVRWQWSFLVGFWQDGGRGQFLVMGMPAVVVMVLGVAALGLAAVNMDRLDLHYANLAQRANENAKKIRDDIAKDIEILRTGGTSAGSYKSIDDDERQKLLQDEQEKEKIYLEKLVSLDNKNPEHKFKLAILAFQQKDPQRGLNLMQMISSFDEPGYAKGHLFLAQYFLSPNHRSEEARSRALERAERQIDNCLIAEETNVEAKKIKAYILDKKRQYIQAYDLYRDLFEDEPIHYKDLLRLAAVLGRNSDTVTILDQAGYQFRQLTKNSSDNVSEWVDAWTNFVLCMKLKRTLDGLDDAETAVKAELLKYGEDIGKKVFLQRQLSRIYSDRAAFYGREASEIDQQKQLSDLSKAVENDDKNESALQWLTILGTYDGIGEDARKIYDPRFDPKTPWIVLSELGHHALRNKN
ncbi:MAG: hypothetical protein AAGA30_06285, partial [Planctomycetota bacterium]